MEVKQMVFQSNLSWLNFDHIKPTLISERKIYLQLSMLNAHAVIWMRFLAHKSVLADWSFGGNFGGKVSSDARDYSDKNSNQVWTELDIYWNAPYGVRVWATKSLRIKEIPNTICGDWKLLSWQ